MRDVILTFNASKYFLLFIYLFVCFYVGSLCYWSQKMDGVIRKALTERASVTALFCPAGFAQRSIVLNPQKAQLPF